MRNKLTNIPSSITEKKISDLENKIFSNFTQKTNVTSSDNPFCPIKVYEPRPKVEFEVIRFN